MPKPILYHASLSPPCRAVVLTAKALGIDLEIRHIDLSKKEHLTPEFIELNPIHTIPTLDDNGVIIYDSHAISSYLVEKYGKNDKLYPKDIIKRAHVDSILHFESTYLFARLRFLYEPVIFFESTDCSVEKIDNILKCHEILERLLKDHPYICGDELTIADFSCATSLTSGTEIAPIDELKFPKTLAWLSRLEKLPYYKEINLTGSEEVMKLFKEKLAENRSK